MAVSDSLCRHSTRYCVGILLQVGMDWFTGTGIGAGGQTGRVHAAAGGVVCVAAVGAPPWDGLVSPPFGGPAFADVRGAAAAVPGLPDDWWFGGGWTSRLRLRGRGGGWFARRWLPSALVPGDRPAASTRRPVGWCA